MVTHIHNEAPARAAWCEHVDGDWLDSIKKLSVKQGYTSDSYHPVHHKLSTLRLKEGSEKIMSEM